MKAKRTSPFLNWRMELINFACFNGNAPDNIRNKIFNIRKEKVPKIVYRYRPEGCRDLDSLNEISLSPPAKFNDPFDCRIPPVFLNENEQFLRKKISVGCFCEENNSLLMWAHYASSHKGICLQYETHQLEKHIGLPITPVYYTNNNLKIIEDLRIGDAQTLFIRTCLFKSKEWEYEKEWRIVKENICCSSSQDEIIHETFNVGYPTAIYIGCEAEVELMRKIIDIGREHNIDIYQMEKDDVKFSLNAKKVL